MVMFHVPAYVKPRPHTSGPVLQMGEARPNTLSRHGALVFDISKTQRRAPMVKGVALKDKGHDAFNRDAQR